jgi:hypothetical protein
MPDVPSLTLICEIDRPTDEIRDPRDMLVKHKPQGVCVGLIVALDHEARFPFQRGNGKRRIGQIVKNAARDLDEDRFTRRLALT